MWNVERDEALAGTQTHLDPHSGQPVVGGLGLLAGLVAAVSMQVRYRRQE